MDLLFYRGGRSHISTTPGTIWSGGPRVTQTFCIRVLLVDDRIKQRRVRVFAEVSHLQEEGYGREEIKDHETTPTQLHAVTRWTPHVQDTLELGMYLLMRSRASSAECSTSARTCSSAVLSVRLQAFPSGSNR